MKSGAKIATCCYCGNRTALTLRGAERQTLSCAACGAPLRDIKWLKKPQEAAPKPGPRRREVTSGGLHIHVEGSRRPGKKKRTRRKPKRTWFRDWVEDLDFDLDFDIDLDDLFD